jgi:hypothetical protein
MDILHDTSWPALPFDEWRDTHATLHLWLQIVGKIRLAQSPWINHSWHVSLYLTPRGLTTLAIPHGTRSFQVDLDFIAHRIQVESSDGEARSMAMEPKPVSVFYHELMEILNALRVPVKIARKANELPQCIRLDQDSVHRPYDSEYANRFWRVLLQTDRVLNIFRARFRGKSSPVHFFWGNMDIALSRFSGRPAPEHPGGRPNLPDSVLRDAYSHEVVECGFWPGEAENPEPLFYCVAYPEQKGFAKATVKPSTAHYSESLKEFVLPYDEIRSSASADDMVLEFLQSTYETAATLARWDRVKLEYQH